MRRIADGIDCLFSRLATVLTVVMIGVALTFTGSIAAASGEKEVKEVKEVKGVKIEKVEKELKEVKELKTDSKARINNNRVFFNRNINNRVFFNRNIRAFDLDGLIEED